MFNQILNTCTQIYYRYVSAEMSIRNVRLFLSSDLILDNMVASKQLESIFRDRFS